jgi:chemotaxis protein histidine kinase CheA
MGTLDDAKNLFIQELREQTPQIEAHLTSEPPRLDAIESARKIVHRIKGAAGFFGFTGLANATELLLETCKEPSEHPRLLADTAWQARLVAGWSQFQKEVGALIDV